MRRIAVISVLLAVSIVAVAAPRKGKPVTGGIARPVFDRAPLEQSEYALLPIGAVKPEGWLLEQLERQADGLTGHLDEIYHEVMGPDNAWLGGDGDAWERGPYWIDGLLPLAYMLDNKDLIAKANKWVEAILASQQPDGYIGPAVDHPFIYGLQRGGTHDWWPKMVAVKILQQHYMATGDIRVIDCLTKYFRYQLEHLEETPLDRWSDWGKWRGADNLEVVYWLYSLTGNDELLPLCELLHAQTVDWTGMFRDGSVFRRPFSLHCVNLGQGFKAPVVWWQYSHNKEDLEAPKMALETIRETIGLPTGLWAGDELIHSGDPARGSELCTAVEMMFSLEEMLRITGDPYWADYLERVAFNALPTQVKADYSAKQYYQQVNQVACTRDWRTFSTPHDDTDVMFGTLNGYPCCLSNMHQGWPKLTRNLWYATRGGGLAALVYAPSTVRTKLGDVEVEIMEATAYPFEGEVMFTIDFPARKVKKASFPLTLRIPLWCKEFSLTLNNAPISLPSEGGIVTIDREWSKGDRVCLTFPMETKVEEWFDRAWSIVRGPLLFALDMEEVWSWTAFSGDHRFYGTGAWEVTSPTKWNWCLERDKFTPDSCRVEYSPAPVYPWTRETVPVAMYIPARELLSWKVPGQVAFFTEDGNDIGEEATIKLIPYGATTLRIAEFPTRIIPWDLEYKQNY